MLNSQEAEKRLKTFRIKNWEALRLDALGKLPEKLRETGRALLLDRDAAGKPFRNWQKRAQAQEQASERLGKMSARDRQRIFAVLFPQLAEHLESAWQLIAKLPYSADYNRKSFRAPADPSLYLEVRWEFLQSLISELKGFDPDPAWCAAWSCPGSGGGPGDGYLGTLLAAAHRCRRSGGR